MEILTSDIEATIIISHGNIISLFLKSLKPQFSFEDGRNITSPDVFLIRYDELYINYL